MGCGQYSEMEDDPRISDSPWLFRMTSSGNLLWERVYFEYDSTWSQNGSSRIGNLFDFIELDNGDIMAVGNFRYSDNDMLIMRVDSNGCLDAEDCHEVNILSTTKDIKLSQSKFTIYPNPVYEEINIEFGTNQYVLNVEIQGITGRVVISGLLINGRAQMSLSDLKDGMYVIIVKNHGQVMVSGKFVKLRE